MDLLTILRIMIMEYRYNTLLKHTPAQIRRERRLLGMFRALSNYCNSGRWLRDYTADEEGRLPKWLKRGVLSQDGLYDLLCNVTESEITD